MVSHTPNHQHPQPRSQQGAPQRLRVTVPGKLMLAGEYSVLSPLGRALATTTTPRLTATLTAHTDRAPGLTLTSAYWPEPLAIPISRIQSAKAGDDQPSWFEKVAIAAYQRMIPAWQSSPHIAIDVDKALDVSFGLGSSSALTLACYAGIAALMDGPTGEEQLQAAFDLVARSNSFGEPLASGYDLLTQATGGLVLATPFDDQYGRWPFRCQQVAFGQNLSEQVQIWVGGKGAPTTKIVGGVLANLKLGYEPGVTKRRSQLWPPGGDWLSFCDLSDRLVEQMLSFLQGDEQRPSLLLMTLVKLHRKHLHSVQPASFKPLLSALASLPGCDENFTFKTTGAGGEDALLLIGPASELKRPAALLLEQGWYRLPGKITGQGLNLAVDEGPANREGRLR